MPDKTTRFFFILLLVTMPVVVQAASFSPIPSFSLPLIGGKKAARMVSDINQGKAHAEIKDLTIVDNTLYFTAIDRLHGAEPWTSKGTANDTKLIKDIHPGSGKSNGYGNVDWTMSFTDVTNFIFFSATDGNYRSGLWKLDPATLATKKIHTVSPSQVISAGKFIFFDGFDGKDSELWLSDGTKKGTKRVKNISTSYSSYPGNKGGFALLDNFIFFDVTQSDNEPCHLWKTDVKTLETTAVKPGTAIDVLSKITTCNNTLYFLGKHNDAVVFWKSDGTPEGTSPLSSMQFKQYAAQQQGIEYKGKLYYSLDDGKTGLELWSVDCNTNAITLVKDINKGKQGSNPEDFTLFKNTLYFKARTKAHGTELWHSDGSPQGTRLFMDIYPGKGDGNPEMMTPFKKSLYFAANNGKTGQELWKSDGTRKNTHLLQDIFPGKEGSYPADFITSGDILFFTAEDPDHGSELWRLP